MVRQPADGMQHSASVPQMSRAPSNASSWQGAASDGGWGSSSVPAPAPVPAGRGSGVLDRSDSWATQEASAASQPASSSGNAATGTFAGFEGVNQRLKSLHTVGVQS